MRAAAHRKACNVHPDEYRAWQDLFHLRSGKSHRCLTVNRFAAEGQRDMPRPSQADGGIAASAVGQSAQDILPRSHVRRQFVDQREIVSHRGNLPLHLASTIRASVSSS